MSIFQKKLSLLKGELAGFSREQRFFILFAMLCGFFVCVEYAVIRPVSNALFITAFGAKAFPYAWLAIVPVNFWLVSVYNRLLPKWGSKTLFNGLVCLVIGANTLFAYFCPIFPKLSFLFYMWKELYIMLMFQLVWSVLHANVQFSKAKYLYGIIFGMGGLGSMVGSAIPSFMAISLGSEALLYFTIPINLCLYFVYSEMCKRGDDNVTPKEKEEKGGFVHGLKLIRSSRFLIFALLIVMFMQMSVAIADFQFNDFLERTFPLKDVRTAFTARIMGIVHTLTVALQFIGTYFIIKMIGFKRSHFLVPGLLTVGAALLLAFPVFPMATLLFITLKALDFSVFGPIKEMLYVPLKPDEKFRAKAVIDVFAYRTSKAVASIMILGINFAIVNSFSFLTALNVIIAFVWMGGVVFGLREYEKVVGEGH